jgi:kinesin family protein 6/9
LGLHYLGRVVLSLGEQSRGNHDIHIPYRDSLLTMALKSSMGGNCKTRMIATINPNPLYNPENIATCKFSQNLLSMENKLKKNQFINPWDIVKGLKN